MALDITEQNGVERRLLMLDHLARIFAGAATVEEAAPKILRAVCEYLGFHIALLWRVDWEAGILCRMGAWHEASVEASRFVEACTERPGGTFPDGVRIGRTPEYIPDTANTESDVDAVKLAREHIRSAYAFPILLGNEVLGVIDCYSRDVRQMEPDFRDMATAVGQIGQFMARKRAEHALRETEVRLRNMADTAPAMIWLSGADRLCTYVNQQWLNFTGRSMQEELTTGWYAGIHEGDYERCLKTYHAAFDRQQSFAMEYRLRRLDGEYRWIYDTAAPRFREEGGILGYSGSCIDITDRKRAEQRLQAEHTVARILSETEVVEDALPRVLRAVCECLDWDFGAYWRVDPETSCLRCAETWTKAGLRITEFETTLRESTFAAGIGPAGKAWTDRSPACLSDLGDHPDYPHANVAAREGLHAVFAFPIAIGGGEVLGVLEFVSRDIRRPDQDLLDMMAAIVSQIGQFMERKRAEQALRDAESDLARVSRISILGELTASIAHEVNQPITAVINNANAGLNWLNTTPPEMSALQWTLRSIVDDARRAADVIRHIRSLAGKSAPRNEQVDMNDVARDAIAITRMQLNRRGVLLRTSFADRLPPIRGDRIQLQQVLINLLVNACDALSAATDRTRTITIASGKDGGNVFVDVRDTGEGFGNDVRDRLFQSFYTTKPDGMGMGLAICRSIVESHGGEISAAPNEPHGAVFRFTLPMTH